MTLPLSRPETTLFMLMSVDGKISSGDTDSVDFDRDLPTIPGVNEGLSQYYDLEKKTDFFSMNTGRVMAKIGVNTRSDVPKKVPVCFVIIDNKPHLTEAGVAYLSKWVEKLFLVTTNADHPAHQSKNENVVVLSYTDTVDFPALFSTLKQGYGAERLTIQSGGTMNAVLLRAGLIDHLSLVVVPVLVGGATTSTLVDGEAIHTVKDLGMLRPLFFKHANVLAHSYLHLVYDVMNG